VLARRVVRDDAALRVLRFGVSSNAADRRGEARRGFFARFTSRETTTRVFAVALLGARKAPPTRRGLARPVAISSRASSPDTIMGALPCRMVLRARLMVLISGMSILLLANSAKQIADPDRPA